MKYAMPVDPRILKRDFESKNLDLIPELLYILQDVKDIEEYKEVDKAVRKRLHKLWFYINLGKGINLRDREKLIPIFQEFARIFRKHQLQPIQVYRGLTIPKPYKNIITEAEDYREITPIIESLAYGLRSWTDNIDSAESWALNDEYFKHDSIVFVYKKPNIIYDCSSYYKNVFLYPDDKRPFDPDEYICFARNPKVSKIERVREISSSSSLWKITIS